MSLDSIYFVLFRRKWIILICAALGFLGAATLFSLKPPRYRSEAKLFIRYVEEGKSLSPPGDHSNSRPLNEQETSILSAELEILQSEDVARQVVSNMGPAKILAKMGGNTSDFDRAVGVVSSYMEVYLPANSSVVSIIFQHPDPEVAQEVLDQIITAYIRKHKEMHQPVGMFGDFMNQETERLRTKLAETEGQLRAAKAKAGVTSIEDAKRDDAQQITRIRGEILAAQVDLVRHQAAMDELPKPAPVHSEPTNAEPGVPPERINDYGMICARLDYFTKRAFELQNEFTTNSTLVLENRQQIDDTAALKKNLEEQYPKLTTSGISSRMASGQSGGGSFDPTAEAIQVRALNMTIDVLNSQLSLIQRNLAKVDDMEPVIEELQRNKDLMEADIKYFATSQERSRIEGAMGSDKAPNIGILQGPSSPSKGWSKPFKKKVQMVAVGGCLGGIALAFLLELVLDRSVKRPGDVTAKLRLPLLISIPDLTWNGNHRRQFTTTVKESMRLKSGDGEPAAGEGAPEQSLGMPIAIWDRAHPLRRFYEGLRDRLIVHFEVANMTQKPKLVAVTSCGAGVGVTSIAAGLAASLSETGDGNVLLVDMNSEQGASQQFYRGQPACRLDDALDSETMKSALVHANLYVASESSGSDKLPRVLPGRFASLMPKLKASDYDYIIFDMPPVSQTSMTLRAARIMDMVLLVIEAEKTGLEVVKQTAVWLEESKVSANAVLNRTRSYIPSWLHQDFLNEP